MNYSTCKGIQFQYKPDCGFMYASLVFGYNWTDPIVYWLYTCVLIPITTTHHMRINVDRNNIRSIKSGWLSWINTSWTTLATFAASTPIPPLTLHPHYPHQPHPYPERNKTRPIKSGWRSWINTSWTTLATFAASTPNRAAKSTTNSFTTAAPCTKRRPHVKPGPCVLGL